MQTTNSAWLFQFYSHFNPFADCVLFKHFAQLTICKLTKYGLDWKTGPLTGEKTYIVDHSNLPLSVIHKEEGDVSTIMIHFLDNCPAPLAINLCCHHFPSILSI